MLPLPAWLDTLTGDAYDRARTRWLVKVYALYATEEGDLISLGDAIGFKTLPIKTQTSSPIWSPVTADLAMKIEKLLGRKIAPREQLRPDLFKFPNRHRK